MVFGGCSAEQEPGMLADEAGILTDETAEYSIDSYTYNVDYKNIHPSQRKDALQIPDETLKKMTTKAVIQAVFDYPMLIEIFLANDFIRGFNGVLGDNNAYIELGKRDNAFRLLLERLLDDGEKIELTSGSYILQYVITLPQYLSFYNAAEMKILVETIFKKHDLQQKEVINSISIVAIGRTMLAANYTPFVNAVNENPSLQLFINSVHIPYIFDYEIIIDCGINFINEK